MEFGKKTVRLGAVISFSNFVIVVEFIVEIQTPRNHFKFRIDAAIFLVKKAEIKVLYFPGEQVKKMVQ